MKLLFDTSVIIAAVVEKHPKHNKAFPWLKKAKQNEFDLIVSSHTYAELYAVLTTLPIKPRISPSIAWRLINENITSIAQCISLTAVEYKSTIKRLSENGLIGGIVYDAIVTKVAQKAKVDQILTFNVEHFKKTCFEKSIEIIEP